MADFYVPLATQLLSGGENAISGAKGADLSWLGNLPDSYYAGSDAAYKKRNQDVFKDGIPPDIGAALLRVAGTSGVPEFIALGNQQGADAIAQRNQQIDRNAGPQTGYAPQSRADATQPQAPVSGGMATYRDVATARGIPVEELAAGRDPDEPLDFDQRKSVLDRFYAGRSSPPPAPPTQVASADENAPATFSDRFPTITKGSNGSSGIAALPPSTSGTPAVAAPQAAQPQAQAQAQPPQAPQPGTRPPALPAQVQAMEQRAQQLEKLAQEKSELAVAAGKYKDTDGQKALSADAERLGKAALSVRESMQRMMEPTNEEKNFNNPAVVAGKRNEDVQKAKDARAEKVYGGIAAAASQYNRDLKPYTELGTAILSDPRTYTGAGAQAVLDFNKVKAIYGNGSAAMLQEGVQKLTAASVLSQINTQKDQMQEAGANSSRLFASQVDQVEKASANMGNTIQGNRFLLNVQQHMGEASTEVARQARDYRAQHGTLDDGFDAQLEKHFEKHPVFTDLERSRPDVLGAPTVPPGAQNWSKEQAAAWGRDHGLKPGDAARVSNGAYLTIPKLGK